MSITPEALAHLHSIRGSSPAAVRSCLHPSLAAQIDDADIVQVDGVWRWQPPARPAYLTGGGPEDGSETTVVLRPWEAITVADGRGHAHRYVPRGYRADRTWIYHYDPERSAS